MTDEYRKVLKKDIQREIIALLNDLIEEELDVIEGSTVGQASREVLYQVQSGRFEL